MIAAYLALVDDACPGLVEGLCLAGSLALGDYRPQQSDIDFVAVLAEHPAPPVVGALDRVHEHLCEHRQRPFFDGVYLSWHELTAPPATVPAGPFSQDGQLVSAGRGPRDPVTWNTLARYGIALRGPDPSSMSIWTDPHELAAWTARNLETYWRPLLARCARPLSRAGRASLSASQVVWNVLGGTRLHYTLATGDITSKDGAGVYALNAFPARRHKIVHECLRLRRAGSGRSLYLTPLARRRDMLAYCEMAITDTQRIDVAGGRQP